MTKTAVKKTLGPIARLTKATKALEDVLDEIDELDSHIEPTFPTSNKYAESVKAAAEGKPYEDEVRCCNCRVLFCPLLWNQHIPGYGREPSVIIRTLGIPHFVDDQFRLRVVQ